jgi:hypothetical protein
MPSTFSNLLRFEKQADGENNSTWGAKINASMEMLEDGIAGMSTVDVSSGDVTLSTNNGTADEARTAIIKVIGALGANRSVIVPALTKKYLIWNATTLAFTVTVKTSAGTGVVVDQGDKREVFCDGTNVEGTLATATSLATPNSLVKRDANGRAQTADPSATADIATKNYVKSRLEDGVNMIFHQASAPTNWTQDASINDRVLRIVSGSGAANGGSWTISGLTVDSHVLAESQIPAHSHGAGSLKGRVANADGTDGTMADRGNTLASDTLVITGSTANTGGGGGHTHGLTANGAWRPAHRDVIAATKDAD